MAELSMRAITCDDYINKFFVNKVIIMMTKYESTDNKG